MKISLVAPSLAALIVCACSAPKSETAVDSTAVATDTVAIAAMDDSGQTESDEPMSDEPEQRSGTGELNSDGVYIITSEPSYITDPFEFSLDSASIMQILGEEAVVEATHTPAHKGEDEFDSYDAYSFYEVTYGETSLSFYSYSGKHFANIETPLLPMRYGIIVGMERAEFLEKMGLSGEDADKADVFRINDDFGSLSFYFGDGKLYRMHVSYEEGD